MLFLVPTRRKGVVYQGEEKHGFLATSSAAQARAAIFMTVSH